MIAICTLIYFLPFVSNSRFTIIPGINRSFNRWVGEDFNRQLPLLLNRNTSHNFFSRVSIIPIPLALLDKEIGIHRHFHRPITGYNKYRYSIHQLVDRTTGVFNRLLYRALYLLVNVIDIDRQFYMPIGQRIGRYRSKNSRTYWSQ